MKNLIRLTAIIIISTTIFCSCTSGNIETSGSTNQEQTNTNTTEFTEEESSISSTAPHTTAKPQTTQSTKIYCIVDGCYKEATKTITGISGQPEYYCKQHYDELEALVDMLLDTSKSPSDSATMGEKNALSMAKTYINTMPFSYSGLVEQLEYEGYSHSEAVYGADNCGADWNEQAEKQAANYLELMPFSRQEIIEQLKYEGYTHSQAVHGAEANGY